MSRRAKIDNANKLINIVSTLLERQERLLQHIGDLEEYIEVLENINEFDEDDSLMIEFIPDEDFKDVLEKISLEIFGPIAGINKTLASLALRIKDLSLGER